MTGEVITLIVEGALGGVWLFMLGMVIWAIWETVLEIVDRWPPRVRGSHD